MTDNEILDLAVEHDIGVRVMPDDYCDLIGVPRGTRYIAENVRPEFVLQFARLLLEKGALGVMASGGPCEVCGRGEVINGRCDRCGADAPKPPTPPLAALRQAEQRIAGVPAIHQRVTPCKHCGAKQDEEHSVTCPYGVNPSQEGQP